MRTDQTLEGWHHGAPVDSQTVDYLLADALAVVNNLEAGADDPNPDQRDRMLELLLNIANLHEYVARHPSQAQSVRFRSRYFTPRSPPRTACR